METYYTVYRVTNKINGKFYIGTHKTQCLEDGYMGSGKYLNHAIKKHGVENFTKEILFVYDNSVDMYNKEAEIVNVDFLAEENTYNLKVGGMGGWDYVNANGLSGSKKGVESLTKKKQDTEFVQLLSKTMSDAQRRSYATGRAITGCASNVQEMSRRALSSSARQKRKETHSVIHHQQGEKNSQYGTRWIHNTELKVSKKIAKQAPLPANWVEGRKIKF